VGVVWVISCSGPLKATAMGKMIVPKESLDDIKNEAGDKLVLSS
jgi:hypothetical protein